MLKQIESLLDTDPAGWKITRDSGYPTIMTYGRFTIHLDFAEPIFRGYKRLAGVAIYSPIFYELNWYDRFVFRRMLRKFITSVIKEESLAAARKVLEQHQREIDAVIMEPERALLAKFDTLERGYKIDLQKANRIAISNGIAKGIKRLLS